MAGVVVRHREIEGAQAQVGPRQELGDVANPRREGREFREPVGVFLHRRAAARRVGDDEVEIGGKGRRECTGASGVGVGSPGVEIEGAATPLDAWHHDVEAGE
jgi:hypothetical protein